MLAFTPLLLACAAVVSDPPQSTAKFSGNDLSVRVRVLPGASLASIGWLVLEFENTGREPVTIQNAYYRIEAERHGPNADDLSVSGGLASGNTYDLFRDAWKTQPVSPIVLAPKEIRTVVDQPSDYSAASLGLGPKEGWHVLARLYLTADLKGGARFTTPDLGFPFEFDWHYPDEAGFDAMRTRLKSMMKVPEHDPEGCYILGALLQVESVGASVSRDDLLTALAGRKGGFSGHSELTKHLAEHFGKDESVIAFVRNQLGAGDIDGGMDFLSAGIWDSSFVEPLVMVYESSRARSVEVLRVLHAHRADWPDTSIPARLSAVVRAREPVVERNVAELEGDQLTDWASGVSSLGLTSDRSAIALLRPALDDRRALRIPSDYSPRGGPSRICDWATDAILTLLGADPLNEFRTVYRETVAAGSANESTVLTVRNRMIGDLKRRLVGDDRARK